MEKEIGRIQKGEYQGTVTDIIVGIKEYNGRIGIDIREFTKSETYTGPTKKGLRIPAEHFDKFKEMINSITPEDLEEIQKEIPKTQEQLPAETEAKSPIKVTEPEETDTEDAGLDADGLM